MADNFYLRLGVNGKADKASIKQAYRKIAKSCHPDAEGSCGGDSGRFRDLQEAYETLSDTEKRKAYDDRLAREEENRIPVHRMEKRGPRDRFGGYRADSDPFGGFFDGRQAYPPGDSPSVHFEAVLSPHEALEGGACRLPVEVVSPCPWCADTFPPLFVRRPRCAACGGTARLRQRRHLPLHIPPNIRHGTVITLTDPSLPGIRVKVRILIDG